MFGRSHQLRPGIGPAGIVRRGIVLAQEPRYAPGIALADPMRVQDDLYRTCVPGPDPKRWLCLYVDTKQRPAGVTLDNDRTPNSALRVQGGFR